MQHPGSGRSFLGIGSEAPPPSGPEDHELKAAMLAESRALTFRIRVSLWSRLTFRGDFDWMEFSKTLERSQFRRYKDREEVRQSWGWSGLVPQELNPKFRGQWLFGIGGYRVPLYGKSVMRHELFHAAQDFKTRLFSLAPGFVLYLKVEYSAHLWGGPLIGTLAYLGTGLIVVGITLLIYGVAAIFQLLWAFL